MEELTASQFPAQPPGPPSQIRITDTSEIQADIVEQIWAQRAAQFAQIPEAESDGARLDLIVARLGGEYYALEACYVFRIRPLQSLAYVPRVPPWIVGVTHERGRILSILNLRRFLQLEEPEAGNPGAPPTLILIETPEMGLALQVDEVLCVASIPVERLQKAGASIQGIPQPYLRGVLHWNTDQPFLDELPLQLEQFTGVLIVLDIRALLAEEKLKIRQ